MSPKLGFSLIELMVTVSVVTLIGAVVLYENSKFNSTILLTNLGYEIALTARQAQVFGLSSRTYQAGGSTQVGYGVYFDLADSQKFILFADVNGNNTYDNLEETSVIGINNRNYISDICTFYGGTWTCESDSPSVIRLENFTVTFLRPNPEPEFRRADGSETNIDAIKVVLKNSSNDVDKRCVLITLVGQISVKSQTVCDGTTQII